MNAITKKRSLGQFFTKNDFWIKSHVLNFIKSTGAKIAYDPFAGGGDLLSVARKIGFKEIKGLDIDKSLNWERNDSLLSIPKIANAIIITNPPYLTNYSAKRKGIYENTKQYSEDLHQISI